MKKLILSLATIAAVTAVKAQTIIVQNFSTCPVNVTMDNMSGCLIKGRIGPVLIPAMSAPMSFSGSGFGGGNWSMANVGIPNPSYGYESSVEVGDPNECVGVPVSLSTSWYNPTCATMMTINMTLGTATVPAKLDIY